MKKLRRSISEGGALIREVAIGEILSDLPLELAFLAFHHRSTGGVGISALTLITSTIFAGDIVRRRWKEVQRRA